MLFAYFYSMESIVGKGYKEEKIKMTSVSHTHLHIYINHWLH